MSGEEYREALRGCALVAFMLTQYDLEDLLARIGRAETLGPFLDPTLYRDKAAAMEEDKQLLEAAVPLWRIGKMLRDRRQPAPTDGA